MRHLSRRTFLHRGLAATMSLPFTGRFWFAHRSDAANLKILILGGTGFLGPHQVAYALSRGHTITTFTRGKTKPTVNADVFDQVESLIGDREDNLDALKGRQWDVVIDNSGRKVKWTQDTAELLHGQVKQYIYVSSVSVYYPFDRTNLTEDDDLILEVPEGLDENEQRTFEFGVMKANSELAAQSVFGDNQTLVIRPTYIVGPGDRGDRFMYWPTRLGRDGDIIIPGTKEDLVQFIDVRDLAGWMIRLAEDGVSGVFNGSGPAAPMTLRSFVYGAHAAFNTKVNFIHMDDPEFLREHNVNFAGPWVMPNEKTKGIAAASNRRALKTGITYRPHSTTVKDLFDWWYSDAVTPERREKFESNEYGIQFRQDDLIRKWRAR